MSPLRKKEGRPLSTANKALELIPSSFWLCAICAPSQVAGMEGTDRLSPGNLSRTTLRICVVLSFPSHSKILNSIPQGVGFVEYSLEVGWKGAGTYLVSPSPVGTEVEGRY